MIKWKRFPLETKNMWVKMGMPAENKMQTPNTMKTTTMRFAQGSSMQMNQLHFINMKMIWFGKCKWINEALDIKRDEREESKQPV